MGNFFFQYSYNRAGAFGPLLRPGGGLRASAWKEGVILSELPSVPKWSDSDIPENGQWMEPDKADEALNVRFYKNAVTDLDHIEIKNPGDERTVQDTEATDWYKMRFRRQWENYQSALDNFAGQTRLETVNWVDPGMCKEMIRFGIHTVEQLSQMPDSAISQTNMIGLMALREKALSHLDSLKKSSDYDELKSTNEELLKRLEALEANDVTRPGRGRPRKAV